MKTLFILALIVAVASCAAINHPEEAEDSQAQAVQPEEVAPEVEGETKNHDKRSLYPIKIIKHVPILPAPKIIVKEPLVVKEPIIYKEPLVIKKPLYLNDPLYYPSYAPYHNLPYYYL
jgi:hypothetical protein